MLICPVCSTANSDDSESCERCNSVFDALRVDDFKQTDDLQTMALERHAQLTRVSGRSGGGAAAQPARIPSGELAPGQVVAQRYEIFGAVGKGGMGTVYKALDRELDRVIALKAVRPDLAANPGVVRRLKQEILLARQIAHRNVVRTYDLVIDGGLRFITMEFIDGEMLKALLVRRRKFAPLDAAAMIRQVCQGLQAAHFEDVIHRDLKPQNVLVSQDGRARILDFGLARSFEQTGLTQTGTLLGTPDYMSPEQALGEAVDLRTDLFAVGVMFYELLTGGLPFSGSSTIECLLSRTRESAPRVDEVETAVPHWMARIVSQCLERDPANRYQSAQEIISDLDAAGSDLQDDAGKPLGAVDSGTLQPGAMLGTRYRIEARAGEGGMGKVYRATDLELKRTVALKVVRPELGNDPELVERLKQEIALASRISHKHILRIHDLGESGGLRFVSMAWADGEDLSRLIRRSGTFAEERILELAGEICEGLGAAHEQGIAHGDLKPTNILLDGAGHACIADFGLAHSLEAGAQAGAAEMRGTPRYMSPEQVENKPAGFRSDLYALGLMLYEMATGAFPFRDESVIQTMAQRVTETPRDPRQFNSSVSPKLARIIMRCLARDPKERYASAAEILADLRRPVEPEAVADAQTRRSGFRRARMTWVIAGVLTLILAGVTGTWMRRRAPGIQPPQNGKYVAVLPFHAMGADSNLKYEAQGVSEAISTRLFSLNSVHPISPLTIEQADLSQPANAIARKVGANLVVAGNVQGEGDYIAIIASLDNVETHSRVWTKSFRGLRADLLTLEEEVCTGVVAALDVKPTLADRERAVSPPTQNLGAYDLYLKGRDLLKRPREAESVNAALALFEQACAKDPSFALAWTGVADASLDMYRLKHDNFWSEKALAAAREAQNRNDHLAEVHFALGSIYTATGKNAEAVGELKRALELQPNSDDGYVRLGRAYLATGQRDPGLIALRKAVDLNPYFWYNHDRLGKAYYAVGRNDDALKEFKRVAELDPGNASAHNSIGILYARNGLWDKAIPEFQIAIKLKPSADAYTSLGTAYFYAGRYDQAIPMFEKAVAIDPDKLVAVSNVADAYRHAGNYEKAQAAYDRSIELAYKQLEVNPQDAATLGFLALFYARKGGVGKAQEVIARARSINGSDTQIMYDEALVNALSKRPQEAIKALGRALQNGYVADEVRREPDFADLTERPEFRELLKRYKR